MEQFDNFEDFFKEEFEDFESEPSVESWEKIREQLHPKPKRRVLAFWWLPTAALVVAGLAYILYPKQHNTDSNKANINTSITTDKSENNDLPNAHNDETNIIINNNDNQLNETVSPKVTETNTAAITKQERSTIENETPIKNATNNIVKSKNTNRNNATAEKLGDNITTENTELNKAGNNVQISTNNIKNPIDVVQVTHKQEIINALPLITPILQLSIHTVTPLFVTTNLDKLEEHKAHITTPVHKQNINKTAWFAKIGATANYRNINPTVDDNQLITDITAPKLSAAKRLGFQAAVGLQVPIYKQLAWRNSINYQGTMQYLYYHLSEGQGASFSGTTTGSSFQVTTVDYEKSYITDKQYFHSVGLQSDLVYLLNKKHSLSFGAGFGKLLTNTPRQNTIYLNAGYTYKMKYFSIEPFVQYHLKNYQAKSGLYNYQPFSFGINIGIK